MAELSKELVDLLGSVTPQIAYGVMPEPVLLPAIVVNVISETPNQNVVDTSGSDFRVQIDYYSKTHIAIETTVSVIHQQVIKKYPEAVRLFSDLGFEPETKLHRLLIHYTIPRENDNG